MASSNEDGPTGPTRPATLDFLKIKDPGRPATIRWTHPGSACTGYVVYATSNPFPPPMAAQLLAGKMKTFVDEEKLDGRQKDFRVARAEKFYCVVWYDEDGNCRQVEGLAEPEDLREVFIDLKPVAATQARTYLRVKYLPGIVEFRDAAVHVWVRDVEPNKAALAKMASGEIPPDHVLPARGDGFVDTLTEPEWRKFYVALALGKEGARRPLSLEIGGYVRLEDAQFIERDGKKKYEEIIELVRNQLEVDLQRKSVTADEIKASLKRADDLAPFHPTIARLRQKAKERFGGAGF
ncbi:MAG: hypothetical protein IT385_02185 [Deltaproteobacteria bacterium]|nr:hypothetical protein [Deltaproteobacteria bacterium]